MKIFNPVKGLLAVVLMLNTNVFAQTFSGRAVFTDGTPCANAKITFFNNFNTKVSANTVTDQSGNYSLKLSSLSSGDLLSAYAAVDKPAKKLNFYFTLAQNSHVQITAFDILGRQTVTIYNKQCQAGNHNFSWDYNTSIHHLDNRVFLINFKTSKDSHTQKFTQNANNRLDFYTEKLVIDDFNNENPVALSYTAVVEGNGFKTHTARHITVSGSNLDFVINKDNWMPFVCGNTYFMQYQGGDYKPFYIKGINLGAAIPGTSPAEMAPSAQQYALWFKLMAEAGYNLIRVYTLHYPRFYEELKKFNEANPASPLYLMHGAWLDEEYEGFEHNADLYNSHIWYVKDVNVSTVPESKNITDYFDDRIKEVVDVVHGNANLPERWGWAAGKYTADVSPWLMGYIVGREIYANEVVSTNQNNPSITSYQGTIFSLANGSPSEVWATQRIDKAIAYEKSQYGQQHPISFSSWPTLDPIDHPTEHGPEDIVSLNLDGIIETNAPAGYFASYHVYPYFPDFMVCDPGYRQYADYMGENSYLGYLHDLKSHYANRPLIISEFGVASSWGTSRFSSNGMHHGGLSEIEQGKYIERMMHNIKDANCGGGILFSWIDEWFKYVWIFGQNTHPESRNRWHNIYSAEENYGLISFIPEEADFSKFTVNGNNETFDKLNMSADIEGLYIKVKLKSQLTSNDTLWLAIDTYNSGKGESMLPNKQTVKNRAEFCVAITNNWANLYVTPAYDMFGIGQEGFPRSGQYFRSIASDGNGWNLVKWKNHRDESFCAGSVFEAGKLKIRTNNDPKRNDAVIIEGKEITVKLPWGMIYFNDPSQLKVAHITDYSLTGVNYNQTETSDGVCVTAVLNANKLTSPRFVWEKWTEASMPKTVQYKKSSYYMVKKSLKDFPIYINQ